MATIGDNIRALAALVAEVKKDTRLSEATILRIVDMNFALAQNNASQTFSGDEEIEVTEDGAIAPEGLDVPEGQLVMFPEVEKED